MAEPVADSRTILWALIRPTLYVLLLGSAGVLGLLFVAERELDINTHNYARQLLTQTLASQQRQVKWLAVDNSHWNEAYEQVVERRNERWAVQNIATPGLWAFGIQAIYFLDPDDRPWLTPFGATSKPPLLDAEAHAAVARLAAQARRSATPRVAAGMLRLQGQPVIVAAAAIQPDTPSAFAKAPNDGFVTVFIYPLNLLRLSEMEQQLGLGHVRYASDGVDNPRSLVLTDVSGKPIGSLLWDSEPISPRLAHHMIWPLAGILLLGFAIVMVQASRASRSAELLDAVRGERDRMESRFRDVVEMESDWIWETDRAGRFSYLSPGVAELLGDQYHGLIGTPVIEFLHRAAGGLAHDLVPRFDELQNGEQAQVETYFRWHGANGWRYLQVRARGRFGRNGQFLGLIGICRDMTDQREGRLRGRVLDRIYAHAHDAIVVLDGRFRVEQANAAFEAIAGWPVSACRGRRPWFLFPRPVQFTFDDVAAVLRHGTEWHGELTVLSRERQLKIVDVWIWSIDLADEGGLRYVLIGRDVSDQHQSMEQAMRLARQDALTGVANRRGFDQALSAMVEMARPGGRHDALLFVDLDGFKAINDTLGHEAGDELLQIVAQRLAELLRRTDLVARLGGDEFAVLLTDLANPLDAADIAEKMLAQILLPFDLAAGRASISASIGVQLVMPGMTAEQLLARADEAMYQAKRQGKGRVVAS